MDLNQFSYLSAEELDSFLHPRAGEKKVGEEMSYGSDFNNPEVQFVVLGIAESVGVKGNFGIAGTHTAWEAFIKAFVNLQNTNSLQAQSIHVLGNFDFRKLHEGSKTLAEFRATTEAIDTAVYPLIEKIIVQGKIPIIIGGSHANAYPIIKGCSLALKKGISAINLDAHADFRALEGRHSGNPFSYSYQEEYLKQYAVIGLHENYNSQNMLNEMDKLGIKYTTWEDIYLRKKIDFSTVIDTYKTELSAYPCGIELDLDAISQTLSSAMGPSGFTVTEARQYAYCMAQHPHTAYLHLCEASSILENGLKNTTTGKLLSYLTTDFIKGYLETNH